MKYTIEQYPKNKDFDFSKMSIDQKTLRLNSIKKKYEYRDEIKCLSCGKVQEIKEYYIKDKEIGRRSKKCRDYELKASGVVEVGKQRFSIKIADKGFRRCSICKEIKPLTEYTKNAKQYLGISNNCYNCANKLHSKFIKNQQKIIGISYIKEYGKLQGIRDFNDEIIRNLKLEILDKRKPKYFIDGKNFVTISKFARYVESKYGLPVTTTEKRISEDKTEEQCKLTEYETRSVAHTKGKIKVTDCKTGEVFIFKNASDKGLLKMFSSTTISQYLKTGAIIVRKKEQKKGQSKYRVDCKIERI